MMRRAALLACGSLLAMSCARTPIPVPAPLPPAPLQMADETWIAGTLADLSLEERVGQMIMVPLDGSFDNVRSDAMRTAARFVDETRVGGFVITGGTPTDIAAKVNQLQARARLPLLIAGEPDSLPGTSFPRALGIGAAGDPAVAELAGRITAREARAMGVHWLFAPVLDLAGERATSTTFGEDRVEVATFGAAYIHGATAGGALTTARHFPGARSADDAAALTIIPAGSRALDGEVRAFRAALAAGVSSMMTSHAVFPDLVDGVAAPASLSGTVGNDLLRGKLGFRGIVVTDRLDSPALRAVPGYAPGEIAVRAVEAGADVILAPPDPVLAHRALLQAVRSGRIHYSRVDSSVVRILRAKARMGLHRERFVRMDSVVHIVGAPDHEAVAFDVAARALTLARDSARVLPLDPRRARNLSIVIAAPSASTRAGGVFVEEMRRIYGSGVSVTRLNESSAHALHDSAIARSARADAAILATFFDDGAQLPASLRIAAGRMNAAARRMVVIAFGDPFSSATLPGAATYLLAWQPDGEPAQRAAARAVAGRSALHGKVPVPLPVSAPTLQVDVPPLPVGLQLVRASEVGMDPVALQRVDSIIIAGIVNGAAPGIAVAIGRRGGLVRLRGYGDLDRRRGFASVTDSSIYDLASLTKVVATTTAVMMLYEQGLIRLDDPVSRHIPEWRGSPAKERVTIRNLLLHNAGLAAYAPFWRELRGREQYRRRIASMSLEYEPGTRTVYSDFGVILLALIVEQVSGQPLDILLRERLFGPLDMRDTGFNPLQWPYGSVDIVGDEGPRVAADPLIARIAPTEIDTVMRMRHIRGQVHDENAFALGGVAGHAGLFSSARDLAVFAQMMLNGGYYGGRRFLDPATIELFTRRQGEGSTRALGWDTPAPGSSAGSLFSPASFGHTGFTGPSIWIDPERDVFVVLLMNRVNPSRDNQRHVAVRRDVADAVQRAITDLPPTTER